MFSSLRNPARLLRGTLAAVMLLAAGTAQAEPNDRIILLSWDGVRRDVLHELLEYQPVSETPVPCPHGGFGVGPMPSVCGDWYTCMPNLCQFQVIDSNVVEGKTLTRPQHAQMLSGYGPLETGEIRNNGVVDVPPGYTIYERLQTARPEIATMHIAGLKFIGKGVVRHAVDSEALQLMLKRGGRDGYTGINTTEQFVVGLDYFGDWPYFFYFVHYKAADVVSHRSGDGSKAYREAIQHNDEQLGEIIRILDQRGMLEGTQIYITTDHGFNGVFHLGLDNPNVTETWMASRTHDLTPGTSSILDVTPTILDSFGIDTSVFDPPYRGVSRLAD